jgi:hypothetical protein
MFPSRSSRLYVPYSLLVHSQGNIRRVSHWMFLLNVGVVLVDDGSDICVSGEDVDSDAGQHEGQVVALGDGQVRDQVAWAHLNSTREEADD